MVVELELSSDERESRDNKDSGSEEEDKGKRKLELTAIIVDKYLYKVLIILNGHQTIVTVDLAATRILCNEKTTTKLGFQLVMLLQ